MSEETPLRHSFAIQKRVIGALLLREILTRYGRHNIGFLWLFIEPMIFTSGVTALWTLTKSTHGSSLPIVAFAVTGYSSILLWRNMPSRCINAISPNSALLYHRNVKIIDIYAARLLLEMTGATISFMVLSTILITSGLMAPPVDISKVMLGWFMLAWFGSSLALVIGTLSEMSEFIEKVWHPISYISFPLSGAAFMVDWLPLKAQAFMLYVPMVNGIEFLRSGYFGGIVRSHYDLGYLTTVCLCMTLLGLLLERAVNRTLVLE
jgi:ABC-2 type transport system permease protein/capsular polysaccharide transport system permease protein